MCAGCVGCSDVFCSLPGPSSVEVLEGGQGGINYFVSISVMEGFLKTGMMVELLKHKGTLHSSSDLLKPQQWRMVSCSK